jgi:hypothetical protein
MGQNSCEVSKDIATIKAYQTRSIFSFYLKVLRDLKVEGNSNENGRK